MILNNMERHFYQQPIPTLLSEGGDQRHVIREVQILRAGEFDTGLGSFEVTTAELSEMVNNFNAKVRKIDLAVDEGHNISGPAFGWIDRLYTTDGDSELWASVNWNDNGRKKIADKEYKYLSSEFSFDYVDNETQEEFGTTLLGVALTNRPVVKGMKPIFFSEGGDMPKKNDSENNLTELLAEVKTLRTGQESLKKELTDSQNKVTNLSEQVKTLSKENTDLLAEKSLMEKTNEFDKKLSEGLVVEAQRDAFIKGDMDEFVKHQAKVNLSPNSTKTNDGNSKDVQEQIMELAEKITKNGKVNLSEAISEVLRTNPNLDKEYRKQFN